MIWEGKLNRDRGIGGTEESPDYEVFAPAITDEDEARIAVVRSILDRVWSLCGRIGAAALSRMTHERGTPWWIVRNKMKSQTGSVPRGVTIPDPLVHEWFKARLLKRPPLTESSATPI